MEIDSRLLEEELALVLKDDGERNELAKTIGGRYATLYHGLNSMRDWEKGTEFSFTFDRYDGGKLVVKKDRKETYFWVNPGLYWELTLRSDNIIISDDNFGLFGSRGNLENVFKHYSKQKDKKKVAERIRHLVKMPKEILAAAKEKDEFLSKVGKKGAVKAFLKESSEDVFDLNLVVSSYYTSKEAFKQLFEAATDGQKKDIVQALIKQKEENKELDKWLESNYEKLAEHAGMEQFIEGENE